MLGHVSEILAGGSRGYKPWCLDRRQREGMRYPGAIFLDFVWSKLVCPPPERGKTAPLLPYVLILPANINLPANILYVVPTYEFKPYCAGS